MNSLRTRAIALLFLGLGAVSGPALAEEVKAPPKAEDTFAVSWQQTSAEYKAMCLQTYKWATASLESAIRLGGFQYAGPRLVSETLVRRADGKIARDTRPVAVVMDLDETVIDNSGYQAWLIQQGKRFSPESWGLWLEFQALEVGAQKSVPGSLAYIQAAEKMGVHVVYVTNREESGRKHTVELLRGYGVSTDNLEDRLLMIPAAADEALKAQALLKAMGSTEKSPLGRSLLDNRNDKERRRLEVQSRYRVLAYLGDNLYDFPVEVAQGVASGEPAMHLRDNRVVENQTRWGADWFVLPNPMYGSWNSSKVIPRGQMVSTMDDFGFERFCQSRAPAASAP